MKSTMSSAERVEATPTAIPGGGSTQKPTQQDESNAQTAGEDQNNKHFPFLQLPGELRNKLYEYDVAVNHSVIHLVGGIGAFRQSPFPALNKQVRREYLSTAEDTCSPIEAVVRNLDFSHVIDYLINLPEISAAKSGEKSATSSAQVNVLDAAPKIVQDTAVVPSTPDTPTHGKARWREAAIPRHIIIKLVFSQVNSSKKTSGRTLLNLLPQATPAQIKRWNQRLAQWRNLIITEPKVSKVNFEYQAKTRMPFEMVGLRIWGCKGWGWRDRGDEEGGKMALVFECALGLGGETSAHIEDSDEEGGESMQSM